MFEPYVIESINRGPETSYPLFSRLLKDRVIQINGEIDDELASLVTSQLLYLDTQSTDPISVYINSPGGSVTAGLSIYDTMNFIDCEINAIAIGQACSMGSFLLTSADKRYSLPNTTLMYHSVSSGFNGTIQDHEIEYKESLRLQNLLVDKIIENANRNKKLDAEIENEIRNKIMRNWYVSPKDALKYGLIDEVLEKRKK